MELTNALDALKAIHQGFLAKITELLEAGEPDEALLYWEDLLKVENDLARVGHGVDEPVPEHK